jgi:hypothetical protein
MRPRLASTAILAAFAFAITLPCRAEEVLGQHLMDVVEDYLAPTLVLPETAEWSFDPLKPYLSGQTLVCGWVDYQSSARQYVGKHRFYAILDGSRVTAAQIYDRAEDNAGNIAKKFVAICGGI